MGTPEKVRLVHTALQECIRRCRRYSSLKAEMKAPKDSSVEVCSGWEAVRRIQELHVEGPGPVVEPAGGT